MPNTHCLITIEKIFILLKKVTTVFKLLVLGNCNDRPIDYLTFEVDTPF